MSDWNPALYSRFEDERTRPAAELLARVPLAAPRQVVDLGCGPGNSTELLVKRFPAAHVVGTDTSPTTLATARQRLLQTRFELDNIADCAPTARGCWPFRGCSSCRGGGAAAGRLTRRARQGGGPQTPCGFSGSRPRADGVRPTPSRERHH